MPLLETVAAVGTGLSLLDDVVKGIDTVFGAARDFLGGGNKPATAVSNITSGSGIGAVVRTAQAGTFGTSVGPLIEAAQGGVTALPAIITAVQQARAPTGLTVGQPQTVARAVTGSGLATMTRKQFILATARANNPGATAKKILRSARECGIELAAATFGLNVLDVCFLIAQPPTRRARGISSADIRRTRATMRKINSLKNLCPPARRSRK